MASQAAAPPYHIHANRSETSLRAPILPPYSEHAGKNSPYDDIELASLSASTSASSHAPETSTIAGPSSSSPPIFTPTKQLQIQTQGKNLLSFPTPTRPDPIPIFTLTPSGHLDRPLYLSVRPNHRSGSSFLTYGDDETQSPLTTTTYRFGFGPSRRPVVVLGDPTRNPPLSRSHSDSLSDDQSHEEDSNADAAEPQGFEIAGKNLFTRAIRFAVPGLGTFGWRYGNAEERASYAADSLLICELYTPSPSNSIAKKEKENTKTGTRIAQLVRNETYRSPGSSRSSAGNGGRLMLDLSPFEEKRRERVEWLVVTTAVSVLKREVDRRRAQQIATIGAIVS
ncbi:hypothetical protein F5B22DRAFT_276857 [Xylaria bambusicola]|uniref:uncharacterized protein n=1 Tax=Xylaria bambusicola TaxID=326684 RepID=UPI0020085B81|nr:uncharacterized protein F5B22DRAFT_276857 [Xylaria bambusicola]KAI0513173.1 hypothetical protein F5B22DRAFT_276857 [Xylaria bambusicola]